MKRLAFISLLCAVLLGAGLARGESKVEDGLRVSFDARFAPHSLPRDRDAPVRVDVSGAVRSVDGSRPPQLRRITLAVNRYGRLFTRGLPVCPAGQLETISSKVALRRCGPALVGRGRFGANVELPDVTTFPVEGRMLAFNGRLGGRPVVYLHIYGSNPVEATVVLTFKVRRPARGRFGTVLTTRVPRIASDLGYVTDVSLSLSRRYRFAGRQRSFLSARCAAPSGFPGAIFSFARGTFDFAGGKRVSATIVRDCLVRG
ncbi:MAG TPA: hypothetical protein VFC52_06755 [Solirubrobacterales bacterium]|nr:hypothetical protein [Solirubrobacterales bacterium]